LGPPLEGFAKGLPNSSFAGFWFQHFGMSLHPNFGLWTLDFPALFSVSAF
jgi:hypothetical protein